MPIIASFTKIDEARRLVHGSLTEDVDRSGEIFDYASSKPEFERWSSEMAKATDGSNLGNVRAMHQKIAAGKLVDIVFDDVAKRIDLVAEIVDDAEWEKVASRVYTGFSPGGKFLRKWADPDRPMFKRYTGRPSEVSLVDFPANPGAVFTMVKAAGGEEEIPLGAGCELEWAKAAFAESEGMHDFRAIVTACDAGTISALCGDNMAKLAEVIQGSGLAKRAFDAAERQKAAKSRTAMPDGSYPIEDKADLENAIRAFGRAKDKDAVKKHIISRAKALDATDLLPEDWDGSTRKKKGAGAGNMRKGMFEVGQLAELLSALGGLAQSVTAEASAEADGSPLPGRIRDWLTTGFEILQSMADEESGEALKSLSDAIAALPHPMERAAGAEDMAKRGARNSKADLERLQAIHDHSVGMGASCSGAEKAAGIGDMAKLAFDLAEARDGMATAAAERDVLAKRVAELEGQPAPAKGRLLVVDKSADLGAEPPEDEMAKLADLPDEQQASALIKHALKHGRPLRM
ncbi:MAG: hypothetical protein M0006_03350 [Magnetospirillum sp.]|nr:hypothetical protein [Magnetospirillum sp.]